MPSIPGRLKSSPLPILVATLALFAGCTSPRRDAAGSGDRVPATRRGVSESSPRMVRSLDSGWRFAKGDPPGAENPSFEDGGWELVAVPHDWSIDGPFDRTNPAGGAGAFLPTGIAWYRRVITLPHADAGRRVFVQFDGVMRNSDVWINGHHLGHRPNGYVSFRYELTDHFEFGSEARNVLAVRADTSRQPASRWYAGSGIYRHVRLIVTGPVHVDQWGTFVSTPEANARIAHVRVRTRVINESASLRPAAVRFVLVAPDGRTVALGDAAPQAIAPRAAATYAGEFSVPKPELWDVDSPRLYRAVVDVREGNAVVDRQSVSFGIRDARFESATGFRLNGRDLKLLGVCLHEDGGAFGAAVPTGLWRQWLATLRTLGVNAIRTAHNPPDPAFLDLCDRMGFLVMDEMFDCWTVGKNPYDYHLSFDRWSDRDLRDTVRRDRNHPCIVLYSAGNEIHDTPHAALAKRILARLIAAFHSEDPTRPVTQALLRPNASHDYTDGLADLLDVIGTNYRDRELIAAWRAKPGRRIVGTEQRHDRLTWLALRDDKEEAGQFIWAGADYLGESHFWPVVCNGSGLLDRTGMVKPDGLERRSWWSRAPTVAVVRRTAPEFVPHYDPGYAPKPNFNRWRQVVFHDWSPADRSRRAETVQVYSNCASVELLLNGRPLGSEPIHPDASPREWRVPFEPGVVRAVGFIDGKPVATDEIRTAGAPARIVLSADSPRVGHEWDDVVRVVARIVDRGGVTVPTASDDVRFAVSGAGRVVAVDNADNAAHEPFQSTERHAYRGACVAYVRATGSSGAISVTASASGLDSGSIELQAAN